MQIKFPLTQRITTLVVARLLEAGLKLTKKKVLEEVREAYTCWGLGWEEEAPCGTRATKSFANAHAEEIHSILNKWWQMEAPIHFKIESSNPDADFYDDYEDEHGEVG